MTEREETIGELPIKWHIPEDLKCQYASNMVVQHTDHEFTISFFNITPPLILGEYEQVKQELGKMENVQADCVGRIIVAASRMPKFVEALQDNLAKHLRNTEEVEG